MFNAEDIKFIVGSKIKALRNGKNLTQEKLAEYLGLQTQTIAKIETGRRFISANVLSKLSNFFNVEPYIFFIKPETSYTPEDLNFISQINSNIEEILKIVRKK